MKALVLAETIDGQRALCASSTDVDRNILYCARPQT